MSCTHSFLHNMNISTETGCTYTESVTLLLLVQVLRYVGVVDVLANAGRVELQRYPKSHAFAQLSGSDNIIAFASSRYSKQPLIVRGPGAGAEVTAGGVFSDILRLASYLGAPS
jgi:aspartokinase/homoserine dehydrogenase 1